MNYAAVMSRLLLLYRNKHRQGSLQIMMAERLICMLAQLYQRSSCIKSCQLFIMLF